MKFSFFLGALLFLAPCAAPAQTPSPESSATPAASVLTTPAASDDQQLLAIEQEWCGACLHGDADYLDRLLTDDFVTTNGRGEISNKTQELNETRDRVVHYTVFENHDMTVHLHGDAAVITGCTRIKGTVAATGKTIDGEVQFTDVFARIEGRWRAIAAHISRVGGG